MSRRGPRRRAKTHGAPSARGTGLAPAGTDGPSTPGPGAAARPPAERRSPTPSASEAHEAEAAARRLGTWVGGAFIAVGVLLLALSAMGRGWSHLLGGVDFIVIGGVLLWAVRHHPLPASGRPSHRNDR